MVVYRNTRDGIGVMADDSFVPADAGNRDWLAYEAFSTGGGTTLSTLEVSIGEERANGNERVDVEAERRKASLSGYFASPGSALVLREADQILALEAAGTPLPETDGYPLLRARMAVSSLGLLATAQALVDGADDAALAWAGIEAARATANALIATRGTVLAIDAAIEAIDWAAPVPGFQTD